MGKNSTEVQQRADEKRKGKRKRAWRLIVYPESAPEGWEDVLSRYDGKWACSPLHDSDMTAGDEEKKPHWHVVIAWPTMKSYEQVLEITTALHAPIPKTCDNLRGAIRYFVHADDPDKYQYDIKDIRVFNGFGGIEKYFESHSITSDERALILADMQEFCEEKGIVRLSELNKYARRERPDDWWRVLVTTSGAAIMRWHIDGLWQEGQAAKVGPAGKPIRGALEELREQFAKGKETSDDDTVAPLSE